MIPRTPKDFDWMEWIWDDATLPSKAKLVASYLAWHDGKRDEPLNVMSRKLGVCNSTLMSAVSALCAGGWLSVKPGGPGRGPNVYHKIFPQRIHDLLRSREWLP